MLVTGCAFDGPSLDGEELPGPDDGETVIDPGPLATPECDLADVRLCVDFDEADPDQFTDGSIYHHPIVSDSTGIIYRDADPAVRVSPYSTMRVDAAGTLDVDGPMSVETWFSLTLLPYGAQRATFLENVGQFRITLQGDHKLRCQLGNQFVETPFDGDIYEWHHVACTFDGDDARIYVDGDLESCRRGPIAFASSVTGTSIGSGIGPTGADDDRFSGGVDNVRVFARPLSAGEICVTGSSDGDCDDQCD